MSRLLFALAGDPGSGKSEGARYLTNAHGFYEFTGSKYLKTEAAQQGLVLHERVAYGNFQRKLRVCRSVSFITDAIVQIDSDRVCNVGIRNRQDVNAHIKAGGIIVAFYCPDYVRFARVAGTDPKYPTDFEEFRLAEAVEYDDPDPLGQHTHYAMANATHWIDTRKPLEDTRRALDEIVAIHSS